MRRPTSDGIHAADWDKVLERAVECANQIDEDIYTKERIRMLALLRRLLIKYGPKPSLLATRADYQLKFSNKERNLLEAYKLAEQANDKKNKTFVASSLSTLYVEDAEDVVRAKLWLTRLAQALTDYYDQTEQDTYQMLTKEVKRLEKSLS